MEAQSIWDKIGGRKFVGFIIVIAAGVALGIFGQLNEWTMGLLLGAYTIYCGSNAAITRKYLGKVQEVTGDGP